MTLQLKPTCPQAAAPTASTTLTTPTTSEVKASLRQHVLSRRDALDPEARTERSRKLCHKLANVLQSHFATSDHPDHAKSTPTIALYHAMKSEVDLTALDQALREKAWTVCYPIMLKQGEIIPCEHAVSIQGNISPDQVRTDATQTQTRTAAVSTRAASDTVDAFNSMAFFIPPKVCANRETSSSDGAIPETTNDILAHPLRRHTIFDLEEAGFTFVAPSTIDALIVPLVAFDDRNVRLGYGGGNYDNYLPLLREGCLIIGVAFAEQQVEVVPTEPHDLPLPSIMVG